MRALQRNWLGEISWEHVITTNQTLCKNQNTAHVPKPRNYEAAKSLWEQSVTRKMGLLEALDVCRRCQDTAPFEFNNANTFAAVGKSILEPLTKNLPPVEGQIILSTGSHFIAGMITAKELSSVLKHFENQLFIAPTPAVVPVNQTPASEMPSPQVRPTAGGLAA